MSNGMARFSSRPNCGEPTVQRDLGGRLRDACDRCNRTFSQNPAPGVAVVLLDGGRILLARRDSSQFRGRWYIPGGFVEEDESVQQAALREAKEETGLDVEIVALLTVNSGFDVPGRPVVGVYYIVRAIGGELHPGDDVDMLQYYALDDVPDLPFEGDRMVIRMLSSMASKQTAGGAEG